MQNFKWNSSSSILETASSYAPEHIYQDKIYEMFTETLQWDNSKVEKEHPVKMGSTYKKIDFLLFDENKIPIVAIEVKTSQSHDNGVEQLGSYMNSLEPQIKIGIVIKDKIYLFYDEANGRKLTDLTDAIYSIPFEKNNKLGETFINLFDYNNFNYQNLIDFCIQRKDEIEKEKQKESQIQEIINLLSGSNGQNFVEDAIISKIIHDNIFDSIEIETIKSALNRICINISRQNKFSSATNSQPYANIQHSGIKNITTKNNHNISPTIECIDGSRSKFIEKFYEQGYGFIHWIMNDGQIQTDRWVNQNQTITENKINGNIKSRPFFRDNKDKIKKIIVSSSDKLPT